MPINQPSAPSPTPPDLIKRRWRIFLTMELFLLVVFVGFTVCYIRSQSVIAICVFTALAMWLIVTLPIAFLFLIGKPPVITLAPLVDSAETRAYKRELKQRVPMDDAAFCDQFYPEDFCSQEIAVRLRRLCANVVYPLLAKVLPHDLFYLACEELDLADLIFEIQLEFGLVFALEDVEQIGGSFDWLVGVVKKTVAKQRMD
jgi:hypothetical protein